MTGRRMFGAQAVAWGLALGTGDSASALEAARVLAGRIGDAGPVAVLYGTDDAREGIAAFVAKRKPRFGGH